MNTKIQTKASATEADRIGSIAENATAGRSTRSRPTQRNIPLGRILRTELRLESERWLYMGRMKNVGFTTVAMFVPPDVMPAVPGVDCRAIDRGFSVQTERVVMRQTQIPFRSRNGRDRWFRLYIGKSKESGTICWGFISE